MEFLNPSKGVCHLRNFNSLEEVLCTVNVTVTGLPTFTGSFTVIFVTNSPEVEFFVVLQDINVNRDRHTVKMLSWFLILKL
jgi:hypothetical protein